MLKIKEGNLITDIFNNEYDIVAHGTNCFCNMGAGIAVLFKEHLHAHLLHFEKMKFRGIYNKLGMLDSEVRYIKDNKAYLNKEEGSTPLLVVNAYTQYEQGKNGDVLALVMCLKKLNFIAKDRRLGIPLIGGGIAGIDPELVKKMMEKYLVDCDVTLVLFKEN